MNAQALLTGAETLTCCECGIAFSVPAHWTTVKREKGTDFYCPNGHCQAFVESENERLRKRVEAQTAELANQRRLRFEAEAAAGQEKAKRERLQRRIKRGVCGFCKRTFQNVARHMACKHPESK